MRIEARLFEILTGFFVLAAIVYGGLTAVFAHRSAWSGPAPPPWCSPPACR